MSRPQDLLRSVMSGLAHRFPYALGGPFFTIGSTVRNRRLVRVRFDGEDWVHTWDTGALVDSRPTGSLPKSPSEWMALFTYRYRPVSGDVIVDLGAGAGTEVAEFRHLVGSGGSLVCVEPDPVAFRRLRKTIEALGFDNVYAIQTAVGRQSGEAWLSQDRPADIANSVNVQEGAGQVMVPMMSLAELLDRYGLDRVDYLKMNIEGAEREGLLHG